MPGLHTIDALPPLLARPLRYLPFPAQRAPLELALEQLFLARVAAGDLAFLDGRCLAIEIEDLGWRWPIGLHAGRLRVLGQSHPADVTIRGRAPAFVLMAGKLEDPDTLFFQRRLVIEGDTELGLGVKNFLDGLDEEQLPLAARLALRAVRDLDRTLRKFS